MASSLDPRIQARIDERIDGFLQDILNIYKSSEDAPSISETAVTETDIFDMVEVRIRRWRNTRIPFTRLATGVVHSIFENALDLDKIHDPSFPLGSLDRYRRQLFRMRGVSTTWNDILLSSPRYWSVINIKSSPPVMSAGVRRSGSAPLCLYCIRDLPPPLEWGHLELRTCISRVQTLRSDDPNAYVLCRSLLQNRTPALRTLQLTGTNPRDPEDAAAVTVDTLGDFPQIHHLNATRWRPSPNTSWLGGLKDLILLRPGFLNTEFFQALSACTSLKHLLIKCNQDHVFGDDELPGAPSTITLPCLQVMNLTFLLSAVAVDLIRRLVIPRFRRGSLEIELPVLEDEQYATTHYCNFLSPQETNAQYPTTAGILMENCNPDTARLRYSAGGRQLTFKTSPISQEGIAFTTLVQAFQDRLQAPSLTVTVLNPSEYETEVLERLGAQNIHTIIVHYRQGPVDQLLAAIGSQVLNLPIGTEGSTIVHWPFESLKSLAIHGADVDVGQIARLVGIWQRDLRKRWLEDIELVNCRLEGRTFAGAVEQLKAMGVVLQCRQCRYYWSQ